MATYEVDTLMQRETKDGDIEIIYPVTSVDNLIDTEKLCFATGESGQLMGADGQHVSPTDSPASGSKVPFTAGGAANILNAPIVNTATAALFGLTGAAATVNNALINVGKNVFVAGTYTGDGAASRTISLGFMPKAVLVMREGYRTSRAQSGYYDGGLAILNYPTSTAVVLIGSGFLVAYNGSRNFTNENGIIYHYIIFR